MRQIQDNQMKSMEMTCGIPTHEFVILLIEWKPVLECQHLRKWQVGYIIYKACFRVVPGHKRSGCISACRRDVSSPLTCKSPTLYQLKNLFSEKYPPQNPHSATPSKANPSSSVTDAPGSWRHILAHTPFFHWLSATFHTAESLGFCDTTILVFLPPL